MPTTLTDKLLTDYLDRQSASANQRQAAANLRQPLAPVQNLQQAFVELQLAMNSSSKVLLHTSPKSEAAAGKPSSAACITQQKPDLQHSKHKELQSAAIPGRMPCLLSPSHSSQTSCAAVVAMSVPSHLQTVNRSAMVHEAGRKYAQSSEQANLLAAAGNGNYSICPATESLAQNGAADQKDKHCQGSPAVTRTPPQASQKGYVSTPFCTPSKSPNQRDLWSHVPTRVWFTPTDTMSLDHAVDA